MIAAGAVAAPGAAPDFVAGEVRSLLDACTACARCVEVCPVIPHSDAASAAPADVIRGVLDFLEGRGPMAPASAAWAHSCNGCGDCIPACPENVNPRRLLMLANIRDSESGSKTPQLFRRMARAIKLMIAMQVVPEEYARLFVPPAPRKADIVFYTGCNALRTPNLMFNAMYLLDVLEVDYEVVGGPSACCGVIATKWEGKVTVGGKVTANTISKFNGFNAPKVLNWCPTCDIHLGETMAGFRPKNYEFDHVTDYLLSRGEELRARFVKPVPLRVVLHSHSGLPQIGRNVEALLRFIPGLEIIETVLESSYTCGGSGCNRAPKLQAVEHEHLLSRVRETGADALVTLYHGCHMAFIGQQKPGGFQVLNFTELLARAAGLEEHPDQLKHYRLLGDWKSIVQEAQPLLRQNGIEVDAEWLERHGAEIFSVSEFRGGLDCLDAGERT